MTRSHITAAEARKLSGVPDEDYAAERVGLLDPAIKQAAKGGKRQIKLRDKFWSDEGYHGSATWKAACELLRERGFEVSFFYEELQFVDMGTCVKW